MFICKTFMLSWNIPYTVLSFITAHSFWKFWDSPSGLACTNFANKLTGKVPISQTGRECDLVDIFKLDLKYQQDQQEEPLIKQNFTFLSELELEQVNRQTLLSVWVNFIWIIQTFPVWYILEQKELNIFKEQQVSWKKVTLQYATCGRAGEEQEDELLEWLTCPRTASLITDWPLTWTERAAEKSCCPPINATTSHTAKTPKHDSIGTFKVHSQLVM